MGASLSGFEPLLQEASAFIIKEELDGSDPNAQLQLNCFGPEKLNMDWILTAMAKEDRLRKALAQPCGPRYLYRRLEKFSKIGRFSLESTNRKTAY